jgi:hypothetical protein
VLRTYRGELVFTFLYDLGGEVRLREVEKLLANVPGGVELTKSAPPYVELVQPLKVPYPSREIATTHGMRTFQVSAKVYAIGAVGVNFRVPFEAPDLAAVNDLSNLKLADGSLEAHARGIAQEIERTIGPTLVETYVASVEPEPYLVIVLTETNRPALELLEKEAQMLAGLVAGEKRPQRLSEEEVRDNLRTWYRYYDDDLVVVDWERALVVEPSGKYDDVLTVMEAANLQLLELRVYDRYLDQVLEEAYEDISRFYGRGGLFRSARDVQEELSNARIDLVRVTDSINNIGKIFGDYYLAKLHLGLTDRFHLHEWEQIVREKMATLNELYVLASHEVEHRRGVVLEGMIVLLFVIDLLLIYLVST